MPTVKVVIKGEQASGKTSIVNALIKSLPFQQSYEPTNGSSFVQYVGEQNILNIWDLSGDKRFSPMENMYNENASLIVYTIDLSNKAFKSDALKTTISSIQKPDNAILILIANKIDLPNAKSNKDAFIALAQELNLPYFISSAKTGEDIDKLRSYTQNFNAGHRPKPLNNEVIRQQQQEQAGGYPDSYYEIWMDTDNIDENNVESAIRLLRDYVKLPSSSYMPEFFAPIHRVVSGHLKRHHIDAVKLTLSAIQNEENKSVNVLLSFLKKYLVQEKNYINPDGSLAKRIDFIQMQGDLSKDPIIDIETLNAAISYDLNKHQGP